MIIKSQREFNIHKLSTDPSVEIVGRYDVSNWQFISDIHKSLQHLPLQQSWRSILKVNLFEDQQLYLLKINNPKILCLRLSRNEVRLFVISENNFLIEPEYNNRWDSYFPFIKSENNKVSFNFPESIFSVRDNDAYLWSNHSCNFSHFMLDHLSKLVILKQSNSNIISNFPVPFFVDVPYWQDQYHQLINIKPRSLSHLFDHARSPVFIFRPKKLYFPHFSNLPIGLNVLKEFLNSKGPNKINSQKIEDSRYSIIFLTRNDARRDRIRNIQQIEDFVLKIGGKVIDPTRLSLEERRVSFSSHTIFIGESSGCMNFGLFATKSSRLISLVEPGVINNPEFLYGGWPYSLGYADRTYFVIGENPSKLTKSPLGTATFSLDKIEHIIKSIIRSKIS